MSINSNDEKNKKFKIFKKKTTSLVENCNKNFIELYITI